MTRGTVVRRSLLYHWRTNLAVLLGVAAATAVLAGALIVGDSVRGSLHDIAVGRLGKTDSVVTSTGFFGEHLSDRLQRSVPSTAAVPLIIASGVVTHEASRRRAANVVVYGVDHRFWTFHAQPSASGVYLSPALAAELGANAGDALLTRVQKPAQIPLESLFGRKDDVGRTLRLQATDVLPRDRLGEFSLQPQQGEIRALFLPLERLQRDLGVPSRVNTVLLSAPLDRRTLDSTLDLSDEGVRLTALADGPGGPTLLVEGESGIVNEALDAATGRAAAAVGVPAVPVFTYLANAIRANGRQIPYSLITATELTRLPLDAAGASAAASSDGIVLNAWAARELGASTGDAVEVEYYLWDAAAGLQAKVASFRVSAVVPIEGLAADRRLAPEYPGITAAGSLADWDPPFPVDLSRVRPVDEAYWREYRTTPKAFISYERGRELWRSRYGELTSLRIPLSAAQAPAAAAEAVGAALRRELPPAAMGLALLPVRDQAIAASSGSTDFGEYFVYFSFFIVFAALLLVVLFFKLGVEQRLRETGILRASGFTMSEIRRMLVTEAFVLAVSGGLLGVAAALLYARFIVHGLRTWWIGAVGTTMLSVHVTPLSLVLGFLGGVVAALVCVLVSLRAVARLTPRALLHAQTSEGDDVGRGTWRPVAALACAAAGVGIAVWGFASPAVQTPTFFGAGMLLLTAALLGFSAWLRRRDRRALSGSGAWALARLGFRSASARPARSVLSAALIAAATFVIVSIDAFRHPATGLTHDPHSGTGGYTLLAQSELPILQDPNTAEGREALLIDGPEIGTTRIARFRMRPGQDASCLNLYRPTSPTILAPGPGFIASNRFSFAGSLARTEQERANPWLLLDGPADDGVPAIADATSLQYVLHAAVGDRFAVDVGTGAPLVLRFVAALSDSVLQGQVVIGEAQFVRLFPGRPGYQFFLVDAPSVDKAGDADALAGVFERELADFGVDAVSASERLKAYHTVENTYLSTFQALGSLGLLLGTLGLAAVIFRNVLERRRELALLRAVGYDTGRLSVVIVAEAMLLLGAGLGAGVVSAALAVAPAWLHRGGAPRFGLLLLPAVVSLAGVIAALVATRAAAGGRLLQALRAE